MSIGHFKKIVEMCEIYYGMCRERIKGRDEGGLEGTSRGTKIIKGLNVTGCV